MHFQAAYYTDKGTVKEINQDSLLLMEAKTEEGHILFAAVADGMGGLSYGEMASARMVEALRKWFRESFPEDLRSGEELDVRLKVSLQKILKEVNEELNQYGENSGASCGTTVVILLMIGDRWYCMSVGDSRFYLLHQGIFQQKTKDHTYIQREMDRGRMTEEQAKKSKMRNTLLQCIGAGGSFVPSFLNGHTDPDDVFFLCSDGMRHMLSNEEFAECFQQDLLTSEGTMRRKLLECANRSLDLGEKDNLTGILICARE